MSRTPGLRPHPGDTHLFLGLGPQGACPTPYAVGVPTDAKTKALLRVEGHLGETKLTEFFWPIFCEGDVSDVLPPGEFYNQRYPDKRLDYTQCSQGYPLENPYGTRNAEGKPVYTLLQNCTAISSDNVDEYRIPTGRQGQITVAPLRSYGPLVVEYLQHLTAARAIPRVRIANREGDRGGAEERQLCITGAELKGRTLQSLEEELLGMGIVESAMKGSWEDSVPAATALNSLRLVAASEQAAQTIGNGAIKITSLAKYEVQRIPTNRATQHLFATEVVIVDYDRSISYEFDADFLVNSINELLTNELGEEQHLLPWPPSYSKPATDPAIPASYLHVRQLERGQIYSAVASEEVYKWIGE
ncbi:hypothetical protein CYMTET_43138 [Cymbomonas tetramitiformis]|uniref:Uncharacterized protein n=1 Tax=Cymbomonas tetramitiformis TaxID=36881 RepID=A0AAE0C2N2_9CHLO|nr:hypothetical protein CYMTET_43138 [Cymbomonas tetramitiformis]